MSRIRRVVTHMCQAWGSTLGLNPDFKCQAMINTFWHLPKAWFWNLYYRFPARKLTVIGVTGTDGKTTTSTMIYHILNENLGKVALISTIAAKLGDDTSPTGLHVTNPDPRVLQKLLAQAVKKGLKYVVLETTSHGLYQHRVEGIKFEVAVFTNISNEHLDHHGTYENLVNVKGRLIEKLKPGGLAVLNRDDKSFARLLPKCKQLSDQSSGVRLRTYGTVEECDYKIEHVRSENINHISFDLVVHSESETRGNETERFAVRVPVGGVYNAYNAAAAVAAAALAVAPRDAVKALSSLHGLRGRWQIIQTRPYSVVVDFAHTPNSLHQVLKYARDIQENKQLIVVFGAASKRDTYKRPEMGKWASRYADMVILTAEDPRGESVKKINSEIRRGIDRELEDSGRKVEVYDIPDRREAIRQALQLAKPGSLVLITGKGHEQSMNIDGIHEIPWDDVAVVQEELGSINTKKSNGKSVK